MAKHERITQTSGDEEPSKTAKNSAKQAKNLKSEDVAKSKDKKTKGHKKAVVCAFGVFFGLLLVVYLLGVWLFTFIFLPNSNIATMDVSLKTADTVQKDLNSIFQNFSVQVSGSGLNFEVNSENSGISADSEKIVNDALLQIDTWVWPLEIVKPHDYTQDVSSNLSQGNLGEFVKEKVDEVNEGRSDCADACLKWDEKTSSFNVQAEIYGTKIDSDALQEEITKAVVSMEQKVNVGTDQYVKPKILKSDSRFESALEQANEYAKANFKIMMGDVQAACVDGSVIQNWLLMDSELNVTLNSEAVNTWANGIADGCNTVGSERTYLRPAGNKTVTISGGTYGWVADGSGLVEEIIKSVNSGSTSPISVTVTQSANVLVPKGQADWGGRWIDVDLTEQHAYMYDNGNLVWETDVVTGNPNIGDATPTGCWMINDKRTNETLKGPMKNGKPEWESKVSYWMPFIGNSHGLHDASWQSTFGGSAYQLLNWSHGCINLPTSKATQLWNLCKIGDAVVIHY